MRALVISAFVLTLMVSALTVFFALRSDSMDGEPYVLIAIDPPGGIDEGAQPLAQSTDTERLDTERSKTERAEAEPTRTKLPEAENEQAMPVIQYEMPTDQGAVERVTNIPEPEPASVDGEARLTPASAVDNEPEETNPNAAEETEPADEASGAVATRTTETAQPIATTDAASDDPFFSSAEPGLGLGVGNLGPIDSVPSAN